MVNLLGNALKFTHRGSVRARLGFRMDGGHARLSFSVVDTGVGIDEGARDRIFEPFVQADEETTRQFGGTGLGLSISRQLVELMGGELRCAANPEGRGSSFAFEIDVKQVECTAQACPGPKPVTETRRFAGRVLIAEDNAINRKVAERLLQHFGCEVHSVENGR
ncbi:MAG: hybrid sensor histidine kinase/response regulator, partial [Rhodocyclaceae bacterium]|nr:hybrid sensor histidine kinase/response regulator [Rhodocyclaceae bacterium]